MTLKGLRMDDARTGLRLHVAELDEARGTGFTLEYSLPTGSGRAFFPAHWHRDWTERFDVLAGEARYRVGRREHALAAGESVELPAGAPHVHPWNAGSGELRVRQTTTLSRPDPAAVRGTLQSLAMLSWLAREGRTDHRGMPPLLQAAPILRVLQRGGGYFPGPPAWIQELMIAPLAVVGRLRGHVAFDPACLTYDAPAEVPANVVR
jgi:mannose-6-phosphate isomerase-like protein (cupin superfamily)